MVSKHYTLDCLILFLCSLPTFSNDMPEPKISDTKPLHLPPYLFSLKGLNTEQKKKLLLVPGVENIQEENGRSVVTFQPYDEKLKWIKGAELIYDYLAVKQKLGKTVWTHGGLGSGRGGNIIQQSVSDKIAFNLMFDDQSTGKNEVLSILCYSKPKKGQVAHEMLRGIVGTGATVEKCGNGFVIVSKSGGGSIVAWQVSEQIFVVVHDSIDFDMLSAYINRLGCITTKEFIFDIDSWVLNEIKWRIQSIDNLYNKRIELGVRTSQAFACWPDINITFPNFGLRFPKISRDASILEDWDYLNKIRYWLWSNRSNFKFDSASGGFVFREQDLYDPDHLPELPEDLRGYPMPSREMMDKTQPSFEAKTFSQAPTSTANPKTTE